MRATHKNINFVFATNLKLKRVDKIDFFFLMTFGNIYNYKKEGKAQWKIKSA
jgi:hypothetical protein